MQSIGLARSRVRGGRQSQQRTGEERRQRRSPHHCSASYWRSPRARCAGPFSRPELHQPWNGWLGFRRSPRVGGPRAPPRLVLALAILRLRAPRAGPRRVRDHRRGREQGRRPPGPDPDDDIVRCRMYWGKTATVRGLVTRDDGAPAAGVTADAVPPVRRPDRSRAATRPCPVGQPLVTDAQGRWERKVKPDRITYYYASAAPQPELGIAAQTRLAAGRPDDRRAPRCRRRTPHQKGASFKVTGRVLMAGARSYGASSWSG